MSMWNSVFLRWSGEKLVELLDLETLTVNNDKKIYFINPIWKTISNYIFFYFYFIFISMHGIQTSYALTGLYALT